MSAASLPIVFRALETARINADLSIAALTRRAGVSERAYYDMKRQDGVSTRTLSALAGALGITLADIFTIADALSHNGLMDKKAFIASYPSPRALELLFGTN